MNRIRTATWLSLAFLAIRAATAQEAGPDLQGILDEIRRQVDSPGLSAAVVVGDRLVWSGGAGLADLEQETPARGATVYRIASISKPIAATAVLQLVEAGKVDLDADVRTYVASFPAKEHVVTARRLLSHTAGIRHYRLGEFGSRVRYASIEDALGVFRADPLLFAPGEEFSYSSYGYNLLGAVVESASGVPFEEYLRTKIFAPAGMERTGLEFAERIVTGRAGQYVRRSAGEFLNAPYVDLSLKWAGGGMISSAEDLARFHVALDGGSLLGEATRAGMYEPAELTDGSKTGYGLGWSVRTDSRGRRWISHSGGATGGTTYLLREPATGDAAAILANAEDVPGLARACRRLLSAAKQVEEEDEE